MTFITGNQRWRNKSWSGPELGNPRKRGFLIPAICKKPFHVDDFYLNVYEYLATSKALKDLKSLTEFSQNSIFSILHHIVTHDSVYASFSWQIFIKVCLFPLLFLLHQSHEGLF
jgi:hypothetical protein